MLSSGSGHVDWPGSVVSFHLLLTTRKMGCLLEARQGRVPGRSWDAAPAAGRKKVALAPPGRPSPGRLYHPSPNLRLLPMAPGVGRRAQRRGNWPGALTHAPPVAGAGPRVGGRPCASLLWLRGAARPTFKKSPGPGRAARGKGRRPRAQGAPSWGLLQMGLYRDDLGIWVLDPESPRHATRSSVARGPSSPQQPEGTANSEGGAGLIRGRRRLGPGLKAPEIEGWPPSVQSRQLLAGSEYIKGT
jgi:hypothetical protein